MPPESNRLGAAIRSDTRPVQRRRTGDGESLLTRLWNFARAPLTRVDDAASTVLDAEVARGDGTDDDDTLQETIPAVKGPRVATFESCFHDLDDRSGVSDDGVTRDAREAAQILLFRLTTLLKDDAVASEPAGRSAALSRWGAHRGGVTEFETTCEELEALIELAPDELVARHLRRLTAFKRASHRFKAPQTAAGYLGFANKSSRQRHATARALQSRIDEESSALIALLGSLTGERVR